MQDELIVDLGNDSAEYYFEGVLVHTWQWSLGIWGDTCALQLSKTDIMGSDWPLPDPSQWYLDDFIVERSDTVLSVKDFAMPAEFTLEQNYPNPFNPTTTIQYQIPNTSHITLKGFDLLGREVAALVNEVKEPGEYSVRFDASALASGVYLYRLSAIGETSSRGDGQAGSCVGAKKLVVLR